jgi:hypothetical protein
LIRRLPGDGYAQRVPHRRVRRSAAAQDTKADVRRIKASKDIATLAAGLAIPAWVEVLAVEFGRLGSRLASMANLAPADGQF